MKSIQWHPGGAGKKTYRLILLAGLCLVVSLYLKTGISFAASTGVNPEINFQGRLLNAQGATVPDGYYNIEFKIYENGDGQSAGDATGSPAGTPLWTEDYLNVNSQGVKVVNGFLSVQLGSICPFSGGSCQGNTNQGVNWNNNTLWLSMNIAGTSTTCATFSACSPDGEMLPMERLSSSAYALNASLLGGLNSSQYLQLAQGVQIDSSSASSIAINKTSSTGDLLELQASGSDAFVVANNGDLSFGNNASHNILVASAGAGASGNSLTVTAGAAGTGSTALTGGNLTLQGGAGGGTDGNGGNVVIDSGVANGTGTNGSVSIGTQYASTITIGSNTSTTNIQGGLAVNIDTASVASGVTIGNTTSSSGTTIAVGTGNFTVKGVGASSYSIGSTTTTGTITIGGSSQTGTLGLQAEGISEKINGSATSPSAVLQTSTDSTTALQIQNSSSDNVMGVNTTNDQVVLGQASALNGTLAFENSTNTHEISLNSTGAYSSYTLTLPTVAPSAGLCLETSTANSSQLVFVSCSNNNANITELQEWDTSSTNALTISPSNIGDEIVLTTAIPTSGVTVNSISGGGVSSWTKVVANSGNSSVSRVEMWVGTVTATGSSTITVTYSGSPGTEEITATEYTAAGVNSATNWGIDASASNLNTTASTTVTFPSINSTNSDELYVGYAQVQNPPATAGSTANFNYIVTGIQHNVLAYDLSTNASSNYQPTASQNSAGESNTVAVMLTAFVSSTAINNSTSLQKANFYVQSATSGTAAGILQAAASGSADILDLRNSSGINVASFGGTGAVALENSTNSGSAFSVQNSNAENILGVNTTSNQVTLGSANNVAGALSFYDSSNTNLITVSAPASIAASYSLALPSNAPSTGLCLETSPSNANQLVFTSCAQQVSAASISFVNNWSISGNNVTSLSDSPTGVGDLLTLYSHSNSQNISITSVSGGGVNQWTKVAGYTCSAGGPACRGTQSIEMWRGIVTTAGASTISVTYNGAAGTNSLAAAEYTIGSSVGTWDVDASGTLNGTSATVSYPSLTPTNSSELYTGYAESTNTMSAGTTTGYSYVSTAGNTYIAYNTAVSGGVATQPTASQSASSTYYSIAATIAAYDNSSVIADSAATQEANFNVQAAKSGSVAGVLQAATSGSADIFDARNGAGNNILAVNGTTGVTLGASTAVAGQLNFADATDSNTISIVAPSSIGASYSLILPTSTPTTHMCLTTSASNANQLVFGSCSTQTTSAAISYVNEWNANGNAITTLNDSPSNVGDLMLLWTYPESGASATNVTGGGVSTWTLVTSNTGGFCFGGNNNCGNEMELWRGLVTSTGANTISVHYPGGFNGNPGNPDELVAAEFSAGSATASWVVDSSGSVVNGNSATVDYPSLTPADSNDLYAGYAETTYGGGTMSPGTTSGYSYVATGLGNYLTFNTSVTGAQQPTATTAPSSNSGAAAALIAAFNSSQTIANSTSVQEANIYLQAATSGSVAGTFQEASGGTANIADILNSSGALVDSFGATGNLLVEPSTNSSAAFEVQTQTAVNVLSVDTKNLRVVIGAGSSGENNPTLLILDSETGTSSDPTEVNGAMYYNATTNTFRCGVAGAWQSCTGLLYANTTTSAAVDNCSNNCAAFSTAAPVPANYCQAGRVIKIKNDGYYSTGSSGSTLQFGIYYGTNATTASSDTEVGALSPSVSVSSANNYYYQINYTIVCFSTSSMQAEGTISIQTNSSNTTSLSVLPISSTAATTLATSSANNFYIFPIWGTASTSNTTTTTQMIVNGY